MSMFFRESGARACVALLASVACMAAAHAAEIHSTVVADDLPEGKRTALGLYLTPADAAEALAADPSIVFIDVRDPNEVSMIGHPVPVDANVPLAFTTHEFDAKKGDYKFKPNPHFLRDFEGVVAREGIGKDGPIFVMCRSGGRSAMAANALAREGYTNVWNLVEGFEGDKDKTGARAANGWRNAGLPWKYKLSLKQAWKPAAAPPK